MAGILIKPQAAGRLQSPVRDSDTTTIKSVLRDGFRASKTGREMPTTTRPSLKRKHDQYNDDEDDDGGLGTEIPKIEEDDSRVSSPSVKGEDDDEESNDDAQDATVDASGPVTKRRKTVHFDMSLNEISQVGKKSLKDVKRTVRRALESVGSGNDKKIADLQDIFSTETRRNQKPLDEEDEEEEEEIEPAASSEELLYYMIALTGCTPKITMSCARLVRSILECPWLGRDEQFFRSYAQLLRVDICVQFSIMIIEKFKEPKRSSWAVKDYPAVDRGTVQTRLHFTLKYLLRLFPAAKQMACRIIGQQFPSPTEPRSLHMIYLDNLLRIRDYAPALGREILEVVTLELVKIDCEFQLDLSDMDDDLVTRVLAHLSNQSDALPDEDESDDESDMGDDEDDEGFDTDEKRVERSAMLVSKLDSSLDRLFDMFTPVFAEPESDEARQCMEDMISDFANFVLKVPGSRHTQFLVFHFSQTSASLQDMFMGTLLNLAFESNRPAPLRLTASAYLSSYVARAARVTRDLARNVANILCHRIDLFRRANSDSCRGPNVRRYQELYSWVQAVLYIFCFRWRDLVDHYPETVDPDDPSSFLGQELEWMPGLKQALSSIFYGPFNPLRVCSPPIVSEFAKLARSVGFLYVYPLLERNKSVRLIEYAALHVLREDATTGTEDEKNLQLECTFPFDPYHLPISKRWLEGDYTSWTPIPGLGGVDDDSDDGSDLDAEIDTYDDEIYDEDTATD